jgi:hypothetical protein
MKKPGSAGERGRPNQVFGRQQQAPPPAKPIDNQSAPRPSNTRDRVSPLPPDAVPRAQARIATPLCFVLSASEPSRSPRYEAMVGVQHCRRGALRRAMGVVQRW